LKQQVFDYKEVFYSSIYKMFAFLNKLGAA
jgi:hypothetical protein